MVGLSESPQGVSGLEPLRVWWVEAADSSPLSQLQGATRWTPGARPLAVTLYETLLLVATRWRWLVLAPLVAGGASIGLAPMLLPQEYEVRALIATEGAAAPLVPILARTGVHVTARKGDPQLLDLILRAATPEEALGLMRSAVATAIDYGQQQREQQAREIARLERLREAVTQRIGGAVDGFALIEYQALTTRLERVRDGLANEATLLGFMTIPPERVSLWRLAVAVGSAMILVICSILVHAWWCAERASWPAR